MSRLQLLALSTKEWNSHNGILVLSEIHTTAKGQRFLAQRKSKPSSSSGDLLRPGRKNRTAHMSSLCGSLYTSASPLRKRSKWSRHPHPHARIKSGSFQHFTIQPTLFCDRGRILRKYLIPPEQERSVKLDTPPSRPSSDIQLIRQAPKPMVWNSATLT